MGIINNYMITYTKETFNPKHVGLRVDGIGLATGDEYNGRTLKSKNSDGEIAAEGYLLFKSYTLCPMPLEEAYNRGLLKVGQKIQISKKFKKPINRTVKYFNPNVFDGTLYVEEETQGYCVGVDSCNLSWMVEILEEPKEEEREKMAWEYDLPPYLSDCGLIGKMMKYSPFIGFADFQTAILNYHKLTKPTLMSKLTTIWFNLTLSDDEKLLRELDLHDSDGKPTQAYYDLQSAIIAKEYEAKVLEEAKKVKEELDKQKE